MSNSNYLYNSAGVAGTKLKDRMPPCHQSIYKHDLQLYTNVVDTVVLSVLQIYFEG